MSCCFHRFSSWVLLDRAENRAFRDGHPLHWPSLPPRRPTGRRAMEPRTNMSKRLTSCVLAGMALALALTTSRPIVADGAEAAKRLNILLILSDDHSVPHVGCYGNPDIKTPNLDRLAAE